MKNTRMSAACGAIALAALLQGCGAGMSSAPAERKSPEVKEESLDFDLVLLPGGKFNMGSEEGKIDEQPVHQVELDSFYLARFEVTQRQWRLVMGENPSYDKGCDECPVDQVLLSDVEEFLRKAGELTKMPLRLPTEAEWEYAAGGGAPHQRWAGTDEEGSVTDYAWVSDNSGEKTHPVGVKKANLFGLHDMSGNVWELCANWYGTNYGNAPVRNPQGPVDGTMRAVRGGSCTVTAKDARVASRHRVPATFPVEYVGLRLAMDLPEGEKAR